MASEKAYDAVQNDSGFKKTIAYLVKIALAMSLKNRDVALRELGIEIKSETTPLDVVSAAIEHLDAAICDQCRSDFTEKSLEALSYALTKQLNNMQLTLWNESGADVLSSLYELKKPAVFATFGRNLSINRTGAGATTGATLRSAIFTYFGRIVRTI